MRRRIRWLLPLLVVAGIVAAATTAASSRANPPGPPGPGKATPIKHLVVIFQENVSFDHYFGTYPHATNSDGQPFHGAGGAKINGLYNTTGLNGQGTLLTNNPNNDKDGNQVNPRRLDPADINDVLTCDQDHNYNDEQKAVRRRERWTSSSRASAPGRPDPSATTTRPRRAVQCRHGHELLRRQHGHGHVELRQELRG